MELMQASREWASRPPDQRFWSLEDLHAHSVQERSRSLGGVCRADAVRIAHNPDTGLMLQGKESSARLTNWSFGQICNRAKAPQSFLSRLPGPMVADVMNERLRAEASDHDTDLRILIRRGETPTARAITSSRYTRIWNSEITRRLLSLQSAGWRTPPARPSTSDAVTRPATQADVIRLGGGGGLAIKVGDPISPAGLYASDRDLFVFMVNESRLIEDGMGNTLARGFFVGNSEVGAKTFWIMTFLYAAVCGNHIVWGAQNVVELSLRHVGSADDKAFRGLEIGLSRWADQSASEDEHRITRARGVLLGKSKDEVLDFLFGKKMLGLEDATNAYTIAERDADTYGDPRSAWGMVNGITALSQSKPYAEDRVALDRTAGKLMEVAF